MKNKLRQSIFASLTSVASIFFISCNISLNNSVPTPIQIEQKWGYINSTGQLVIPLRFDEACPFSEGLAKVSIGDKSGYINQSGKLVVPLQYDEALSFALGAEELFDVTERSEYVETIIGGYKNREISYLLT